MSRWIFNQMIIETYLDQVDTYMYNRYMRPVSGLHATFGGQHVPQMSETYLPRYSTYIDPLGATPRAPHPALIQQERALWVGIW